VGQSREEIKGKPRMWPQGQGREFAREAAGGYGAAAPKAGR